MKTVLVLALGEIREGLRNRWVAASIVLLATLAFALSALGSAPTGTVNAHALSVSVASLSSLSVYLVPLIALMLSFPALVGELERGTLLLLLTYPVARWQIVVGKFVGHLAILMLAVLVGYGAPAIVTGLQGDSGWVGWQSYLAMMGSSVLLGAAFIALGYLVSASVRERATAAGLAIGVWLVFVVLYDIGLLGLLLADGDQRISPALFSSLMLINPTDAYRIFNLMGSGGASLVSGLAGLADQVRLSVMLPIAVITLWVVAPLAAATALFYRREV
ncbi:MAG: ABC transporter permease subunit [Gammaproteobacteria bacterium]|jgi:Cu-processing system permease protein|nr:ABC transporter permease subunit [Gammaproteobacteria bacterium]